MLIKFFYAAYYGHRHFFNLIFQGAHNEKYEYFDTRRFSNGRPAPIFQRDAFSKSVLSLVGTEIGHFYNFVGVISIV